MFVEMPTPERHNLHGDSFDFSSVTNAILTRGSLMKMTNMDTIIPLSSHPDRDRIFADVSNGTIRACAPMGGMKKPVDWSDAQRQKLHKALARVAEIEKDM